jgi:hypothetical protein
MIDRHKRSSHLHFEHRSLSTGSTLKRYACRADAQSLPMVAALRCQPCRRPHGQTLSALTGLPSKGLLQRGSYLWCAAQERQGAGRWGSWTGLHLTVSQPRLPNLLDRVVGVTREFGSGVGFPPGQVNSSLCATAVSGPAKTQGAALGVRRGFRNGVSEWQRWISEPARGFVTACWQVPPSLRH